MRNCFLWSYLVFEKEVIFNKFDFENSDLEPEVSKSSIRKCTTWCDKGVFSIIFISQFSQVCYLMHMLRLSLTITNSVHCLSWDYCLCPEVKQKCLRAPSHGQTYGWFNDVHTYSCYDLFYVYDSQLLPTSRPSDYRSWDSVPLHSAWLIWRE